MPKTAGVTLLLLSSLVTVGCAGAHASLKTYADPSIDTSSVRSVALLPMRNARLLADEARELNRAFLQALKAENPNVTVIAPVEATDALNRAGLTPAYSDFLRNYAASGVPDARVLQQVGAALKADAIFQGEVFDIREQDGQFGVRRGETQITVRYALLSTRSGTVLWEATSRGTRANATTLGSAPPMYEAISLAQDRILAALPRIGSRGR